MHGHLARAQSRLRLLRRGFFSARGVSHQATNLLFECEALALPFGDLLAMFVALGVGTSFVLDEHGGLTLEFFLPLLGPGLKVVSLLDKPLVLLDQASR